MRSARYTPERLSPYGLGQEPPAGPVCGPAGPTKQIRLCMQRLGKPGPVMRSAQDVCQLLRGAGSADRESFYAMHLDIKNRVIGTEEVSRGSVSGVEVHPREVFKSAILSNATAILMAHNHPSGDPTPSSADIELTRRLADAGENLGISVRDHVIVTDTQCRSMRDTAAGMGIRFRGAAPRRGRGSGFLVNVLASVVGGLLVAGAFFLFDARAPRGAA